MRIAVFGGSGRLGRCILRQATARGHQVKSLVRDPSRIKNSGQTLLNLEIVQGNPVEINDLDKTIADCDAVVTTLNISRYNDFPWAPLVTPSTLLSDTAAKLLEVMSAHKVRRLVAISAWGVSETRAQLPYWFRWLVDNSNIGPAYADHERQERIIRASDADWTLLRPAFLSNKPVIQDYQLRASDEKPAHLYISRESVAAALLEVLESEAEILQVRTVCR